MKCLMCLSTEVKGEQMEREPASRAQSAFGSSNLQLLQDVSTLQLPRTALDILSSEACDGDKPSVPLVDWNYRSLLERRVNRGLERWWLSGQEYLPLSQRTGLGP